ncbi:MAG: lysophospholipid acyltransferase family protein [Ginsengibacter sp.]
MKKYLGKIFAVWGIISFLIFIFPVALILWIIGLIPEPKRTRVFRITVNVWMRIWLFLIGSRLKIKGKENFAKGKNYIITCNHNSFMDVVATTPFIPGPNKTIAKIELSKIPVFGLIYKRGSVLVDRKDKDSRKDSFAKMKQVLEMGMHMCIYPEGTRNDSDALLTEFKDGAFKLAEGTGYAIIPTLLFNTKKIMPPKKGFYLWPATIHLHFLPPVPVNKGDNYLSLKEKVYQIMENYLKENKAKLK